MAEDSKKNDTLDLATLLSEEIPDTKEEILKTSGGWFKESKNKLICPYIREDYSTNGIKHICNYYYITNKKPARIDCYICKKKNE